MILERFAPKRRKERTSLVYPLNFQLLHHKWRTLRPSIFPSSRCIYTHFHVEPLPSLSLPPVRTVYYHADAACALARAAFTPTTSHNYRRRVFFPYFPAGDRAAADAIYKLFFIVDPVIMGCKIFLILRIGSTTGRADSSRRVREFKTFVVYGAYISLWIFQGRVLHA